MKRATVLLLTATALLATGPAKAKAELTPEELAMLSNELTPVGGERAGNADGTIPPWEGGITQPPAGYRPGDHHPDPFPDDEVLFTITKDNMAQYASKLSDGHQQVLKPALDGPRG